MTAPSEFEAFGQPIPWERKAAALTAVRAMVPDVDTERATTLVGAVAEAIERDQPYEALAIASGQSWPVAESSPDIDRPRPAPAPIRLDVTGAYRLVAHLCTDPA